MRKSILEGVDSIELTFDSGFSDSTLKKWFYCFSDTCFFPFNYTLRVSLAYIKSAGLLFQRCSLTIFIEQLSYVGPSVECIMCITPYNILSYYVR